MDNRIIIQNILEYVDKNLKNEITCKQISNLTGYSSVHINRLFKSYIGVTLDKYILHRRLLHAVYEISNEANKLDTAINYGFETYSGFYKAFVREFNQSPTEFIKLHKTNKPCKINILQKEHIMISKNEIKKLLTNWNLENEKISNIYSINTGKQNDQSYYIGENYIIKFSSDLNNIKNNIIFSNKLLKMGVPTGKIVETNNKTDYIENNNLYFIIIERIKGTTLKCEDIFKNTDIAYLIGENIAKLHNALKEFNENNYRHADIYNEVINYALPEIEDKGILNKSFIDEYKTNLNNYVRNIPNQIIHRDINPSNMLFENNKFKGFIDFELTEVNCRIFDICYCATSILSESFKNPNLDKNTWIKIYNNLISGYERIIKLTYEEKQSLKYIVYSIQIICIEYFGKFDEYEDLTQINIDMLLYLIKLLN